MTNLNDKLNCPFENTCCPEDYEDIDFYKNNCVVDYLRCDVYKSLMEEVQRRR